MPITYHSGQRGVPGFLTYITGSDNVSRGTVVPAFVQVDSTGAEVGAGTVSSPVNTTSRGAASFATGQTASSVSPAAAIQIVPARAGRTAVTLSNITGTQPVYFVTSNVTTGVTTGFFLAGTAGASVTIPTAAAIFATSPTAAQTVSFLETF